MFQLNVPRTLIRLIFPLPISLPFNTENPVGFTVAILTDFCICLACVLSLLSFSTIYIGICLNIKSCIDDISLTVAQSNVSIAKNESVHGRLAQLIQLHIGYYK